jgi:hypothetical protein
MTRDELRSALDSQTDGDFVEREIIDRRRPWIFDADESHQAWRTSVAGELGLGTDSIYIVGSAATGFSLSPLKPGRPFRPLGGADEQTSDIDIALIDPSLFELAWETIVSFDRRRSLNVREDVRTKIRLDVYWGLVGQHSLPRNTYPARKILTAMIVAGRIPPLRGYEIRCRVYRRIEDLRAYHIASLHQVRRELAISGA